MAICVAVGNKVMDTRLPQPVWCGDKYDVSDLSSGLLRRCTPRNDAERNNIAFKSLDVVRQYALKIFETAENGVDKVVSSCEKNSSVHRRYMNFLRQRKTALDAPLYAVSAGRSMIEMLGVLAIIGVLSVGGIAGYSKAMELWKISRQKEQLAELFLQCVNLKDDFLREYNTTKKIVPTADIMEAMGVIPDGMKKASSSMIKDFADNLIYVYFTESKWSNEDGTKSSVVEYILMFDIYSAEKSSRLKQQYCVTFLEQAQAVSPSIKLVESRGSNDSFGGYNVKNIKIGSAKPNEIYDFCKKCNSDKACQLVLHFKL